MYHLIRAIVAVLGVPFACWQLTSRILWPEMLGWCAPAYQKHGWFFLSLMVWTIVAAVVLHSAAKVRLSKVILGGILVMVIILVAWALAWKIPLCRRARVRQAYLILVAIAEMGKTEDERNMVDRIEEGVHGCLHRIPEFAMERLCHIFRGGIKGKEKIDDVAEEVHPAILIYGWRDEQETHTRLRLDVARLRLDEITDQIRRQHLLILEKYKEENAWAMALPVSPEFVLRFLGEHERQESVIVSKVMSICEECTVLLASGLAFHMNGHHDTAQLFFEKAIQQCPEPGLSGTYSAIEYAAQGYLDETIDQLKRASQANPDRMVAWETLADLQLLAGHYAEAQASLETLVRYLPDDATARYKLGYAHFAQGETEEAIAAWEIGFNLNPDLITRDHLEKNVRFALEILEVEADPTLEPKLEFIVIVIGYNNLGDRLYQSSLFAEASRANNALLIESIARAIPLPEKVEAQVRQKLAFSYVRQHRWTEAEQALKPLGWSLRDYLMLSPSVQQRYKDIYGLELWEDLRTRYETELPTEVQPVPHAMWPEPFVQPMPIIVW